MPADSPRIVVVGTCGSGKSTMVAALRARGFDASVCAQEHSEIASLWNHTRPDVLVLLEIDLRTVRARRDPAWPETIFLAQQRRLQAARAAADVIIDTAEHDLIDSIAIVEAMLARPERSGDCAQFGENRRPA